MLEKFITQLEKEFEVKEGAFSTGSPGSYSLPLDEGVKISITQISDGLSLKCVIAPFPSGKQGEFCNEAMLANLFGQGTHGAILGISHDESTVNLAQYVEYQVDYKSFKEILEDFINAVDFWRDEIATLSEKDKKVA